MLPPKTTNILQLNRQCWGQASSRPILWSRPSEHPCRPAYTALLSGVNGDTGLGLVEVYDLGPQ
jgi:hypothetical protein